MAGAHRAVAGRFGGVPVFVDASGRRRRTLCVVGWLGAALCAAYVAAFGVTLTTSVGALDEVSGSPLTPTPLPAEDADDGDGTDVTDAVTPDAAPVVAVPVVAATPAASRGSAVRPVVTTQRSAPSPTTRSGTRLVELRRREPTAAQPTSLVRRGTAVAAVPRRAVAAAPSAPARPTATVPPSIPTTPPAGSTTTPRSGTTGSGSGTGTAGSGTGGGTTGSGTGTTGTGATGTGTTGTGTSPGSGTVPATGTSGTPAPTGTATGAPGRLMDAVTSDVTTLGPSTPGAV